MRRLTPFCLRDFARRVAMGNQSVASEPHKHASKSKTQSLFSLTGSWSYLFENSSAAHLTLQ